MKRLGLIVLALLVFFRALSGSAGFSVFANGSRAAGMAWAFTALALDPSAIFFNPAGLAFQEQAVYLGGNLNLSRGSFAGAAPFPGQNDTQTMTRRSRTGENLYVSLSFGPKWKGGIGLFIPWEQKMAWENPALFSGRFISFHSEIGQTAVAAVLSCQVNDRLAVGWGCEIRFSRLRFGKYLPIFDPFSRIFVNAMTLEFVSDTAADLALVAGLMYRPNSRLSFGFSFRNSFFANLKGQALLTPVASGKSYLDTIITQTYPRGALAGETRLASPATLSLGVAGFLDGGWKVAGDLIWTGWNRFNELALTLAGHPELDCSFSLFQNDSLGLGLGFEKEIGSFWFWRAGIRFETSALKAENLSPFWVDADRTGFTMGIGYQKANFWLDGALAVIFIGRASTAAFNPLEFYGTYDLGLAVSFGIHAGYRF